MGLEHSLRLGGGVDAGHEEGGGCGEAVGTKEGCQQGRPGQVALSLRALPALSSSLNHFQQCANNSAVSACVLFVWPCSLRYIFSNRFNSMYFSCIFDSSCSHILCRCHLTK